MTHFSLSPSSRSREYGAVWTGLTLVAAIGLLTVLAGCGQNGGEADPSVPEMTVQEVVRHVEQPADASITAAVERELEASQGLEDAQIAVSTSDGIVTLEGSVPTLIARERATRLAETVRGVRSVIPDLDVAGTDRPDEDIRQDVRRALASDPAVAEYGIDASVRADTVVLSGQVDSWKKRRLAEEVVRRVRGVRGIENDVAVTVATDRTPSEIELEIERALRWNTRIDASQVEVTVRDSTAILNGVVGSAYQKKLAARESFVRGVRSVDTDPLRVAAWMDEPGSRGERTEELTDSEIEAALEEALVQAPRLEPFTIKASVEDRAVTLSGMVDNLQARRTAERVAQNTWGVRTVENELRVEPDTDRSESVIRADIVEAFERDPYVDADRVEVAVEDGTVVLDGTLATSYMKWQAGSVAARIEGVTSIENRISVQQSPTERDPAFAEWNPVATDFDFMTPVTADTTLDQQILEYIRWSPALDTAQIDVHVEDGRAVLSGTVDTRWERRQAMTAAYEGGAVSVTDSLRIVGHPSM